MEVNGGNTSPLIAISEYAEALKWQDRFGGERGSSSDGDGVTPAAESPPLLPGG